MKKNIIRVNVDVFIKLNSIIIDNKFCHRDEFMLNKVIEKQCEILGIESNSEIYPTFG